jgi:hypothetical protein
MNIDNVINFYFTAFSVQCKITGRELNRLVILRKPIY